MVYDDTNRGALFKNDKQGNEKRPDYRGPLNVDGKELEMAAWIRKSEKGVTYMSVTVQPKKEQGGGDPKGSSQADDFDDPIPFVSSDSRFDVEWRR